jgi:hypothetical protein
MRGSVRIVLSNVGPSSVEIGAVREGAGLLYLSYAKAYDLQQRRAEITQHMVAAGSAFNWSHLLLHH